MACVRNPLKLYGGRSGAKVRRGQKERLLSVADLYAVSPLIAAMAHTVRRYILYVF